jgi:hypothetical protein
VSSVVLDDHLLRDVLTDEIGPALRRAMRRRTTATTNLYYVRLCRSAQYAHGGKLTGSWPAEQRRALSRVLGTLPDEVGIVPMRALGVRLAELAHDHGLSVLGAEADAAAEHLGAPLCVWEGDDGPRIRACAAAVGVDYRVIDRG